MEQQDGVYRGKVDFNVAMSRLKRCAQQHGFTLSDLRIEGSQANGHRGSKYTDLDVSAERPPNLTQHQLDELQRIIVDETGIDFYFR